MSYADLLREELVEVQIKKPCCRAALTAGLLLCAAAREKSGVFVRYRNEPTATLASAMIRERYAKSADSEMTGACGHRYYDLSFSSPAAHKLVMQMQSEGGTPERLLHFSCDTCASSFLRGAFLACGTMNDPQKSLHLELLTTTEAAADFLSAFLESLGYPPRRIARKNGVGLYYKNGQDIEDLLGLTGAQQLLFEFMNARITREIRNQENRAINCETKNLERTIAAGAKQLQAIGRLVETGRIERLPESLKATAILRYQNPDATLDMLALMHEPPISKSGLNHRLKKLLEEAESLTRKEPK